MDYLLCLGWVAVGSFSLIIQSVACTLLTILYIRNVPLCIPYCSYKPWKVNRTPSENKSPSIVIPASSHAASAFLVNLPFPIGALRVAQPVRTGARPLWKEFPASGIFVPCAIAMTGDFVHLPPGEGDYAYTLCVFVFV